MPAKAARRRGCLGRRAGAGRFEAEREEAPVAIAALVLWLCTAAVGSYLLLIGVRSANAKSPAQEPVAVAAERHAADGQAAASAQTPAAVSAQTPAAVSAQTPAAVSAQAAAGAPARPARDKDRWDPPSLQRAKSEPLPGLRR